MILKKLKLKNIRSYDNEEIEFPEGSLLLAGDIGSGKTSILLAIEYALFGLQPGQKGSALLRNNEDYGEVTLELDIEGKNIVIERKLKRSSKSISNEYAALSVDGEKIESSITEIKTRILDLLNYPQEFIKKNNLLYRYTVYTPQEQMKQIILEEPEVRLNILRHIFGIDKYKTIRENLDILLVFLKEETKFLQGEIKTLDSDALRLVSLNNSIDSLKNKLREQDLVFREKNFKRKEMESQVSELTEKIEEKKTFEKEVDKSNILLTSKKETLLTLNRDAQEIVKNLSETKETFNSKEYSELLSKLLEKQRIIDNLNSRYFNIVGQMESLEHLRLDTSTRKEKFLKIDRCPTCFQDVQIVHKHTILTDFDHKLKEIKETINTLNQDKSIILELLEKEKKDRLEMDEKRTKLEVLRTRAEYIEKSKRRLEDINKLKENLEKDSVMLSQHIDSLKENILKYSVYDNLFRIRSDELRNSFLEEKNAEISLAELNKEIELTLREISALKETISQKDLSKKRLAEVLSLNDWLSVHFKNLIDFIERNVMLRLRLEFSKLFNKWFHILAGESFEVQLDETFTPIIMQGEIEMEYSFLSGGERTALALAYRLALNQTLNSLLSQIKTHDIIILDEPTEGFSEAQIDKIRDILDELNVKQLILVSHEQKVESFVDHVIRVKKENNSSSIKNLNITHPSII